MQKRVRWVVRMIRELDRALSSALRAPHVERPPPACSEEDDLRQLRVCRDTLRAAVDALEELATQVRDEALRHRELVDFLPSGYLETDLDGVIRRANAQAARMLRWPEPVLQGKPLVAFVAERDFPEFLRGHGAARERRSVGTRVVTLRPQEGKPLRASIAVGALHAEAGELAGFRCLLQALEDR